MNSLGDLIARVGINDAGWKAGFASIEGDLKKLGNAMENIGAKFASVGTALTAAITVPLAGVGAAALKVSGDLEQASIAFTTMLGSAQRAQTHLEELKKFALGTPFQFPDLVSASKRLQALGFTAKEIIPTLTAVGNATAALGTGALGIERITLALGQMQSKGKVSAQEMRQLAEAGIPAWQILADAISKAEGRAVSVAEVMKKAEHGFIDGTMAVEQLVAGMNAKFGGLMEAQSRTLLGTWEKFKEKMTFTLAGIGDALAPVAKRILDVFTDLGEKLNEAVQDFRKLPEWIQTATIAMAGLAAAAGPVLFVFGQFTASVGSIITLFTKFTPAVAAAGVKMGIVSAGSATLASSLTVLGVALGAVAAAVAAVNIGGLLFDIGKFIVELPEVNEVVREFLIGIRAIASVFEQIPGVKTVQLVLETAIKDPSGLFQSFKNSLPGFREMKMFGDLKSMFGDNFTEFFGDLDKQISKKLKPTFGDAADEIEKFNRRAVAAFEESKAKAEEWGKRISSAFSHLGLTDFKKEARTLQEDLDLLWKNKLIGPEQYAIGLEKVRNAMKAVEGESISAQKALDKYNQQLALFENIASKIRSQSGIDMVKSWFPKEWFEEQKKHLKELEDSWNRLVDMFRDEKIKAGINLTLGSKAIEDIFALGDAVKHFGLVRQHEAEKILEWNRLIQESDIFTVEQKVSAERRALEEISGSREKLLIDQIRVNELLGTSSTSQIIQLENLRIKMDQLATASRAVGEVYIGINRAFDGMFSSLEKGLTDFFTSGGKISGVFKNILKGLKDDLISTFTGGIVEGIRQAWLSTGIQQAIAKALTKVFETIFGGLFKVGAAAAQATAVTANTTALTANTAAITSLTGALTGSAATGAAGSAAGGIGKAAGAAASGAMGMVNMISGAVSAISSVIGNFQMAGMNKSLDIIVKHTLETKAEVENLRRDEWLREDHLFKKLDDMWNEIRAVVSACRDIADNIGSSFGRTVERLGNLVSEVFARIPALGDGFSLVSVEDGIKRGFETLSKSLIEQTDRLVTAITGIAPQVSEAVQTVEQAVQEVAETTAQASQQLGQQITDASFDWANYNAPNVSEPDGTNVVRAIYSLGQLIVEQFDRLIAALGDGIQAAGESVQQAVETTTQVVAQTVQPLRVTANGISSISNLLTNGVSGTTASQSGNLSASEAEALYGQAAQQYQRNVEWQRTFQRMENPPWSRPTGSENQYLVQAQYQAPRLIDQRGYEMLTDPLGWFMRNNPFAFSGGLGGDYFRPAPPIDEGGLYNAHRTDALAYVTVNAVNPGSRSTATALSGALREQGIRLK